jgi:transposase InsO family protein
VKQAERDSGARKRTTIPDPAAPARTGLNRRDFTADASRLNTRWCGDITYIPTGEGWLYLAENHGVILSHGRTGQCWDNALAESFFSAIKGELLDDHAWPDRTAARHAVTGYIAWYNGTRLHSALGYRAPAEYEAAARQNDHQVVA